MLLNSLPFLWFFIALVVLWYTVPMRFRQILLLGASIYFYATWSLVFLWVLGTCVVTAWGGGIILEKLYGRQKKAGFSILLSIPIALLLFFKYFNFFSSATTNFVALFVNEFSIPSLKIVLPIGISFFVFKTISYLIDIFTKKLKTDTNFLSVANYITFFPQILAGPIERAPNFLPQLAINHKADPTRIKEGLIILLWGLFKKVVIADNCASVVNWVYAAPSEFPGLALIIATYCYAVQIYCDFSGYSDMAIGVAKILGFNTMANFNRPYSAISVSDFWRRWHISLSSWFRDYLYIPLGGSRVNLFFWSVNILIVFVVSGLWHGANWTFIIWGLLQGLFLISERILSKPIGKIATIIGLSKFPKLIKVGKIFLTFHLITFAWIFFRARSVNDAFYIVNHLFDNLNFTALNLFQLEDLKMAGLSIGFILLARLLSGAQSGRLWLENRPLWVRWTIYAIFALSIVNLKPVFQSGFIYLNF